MKKRLFNGLKDLIKSIELVFSFDLNTNNNLLLLRPLQALKNIKEFSSKKPDTYGSYGTNVQS